MESIFFLHCRLDLFAVEILFYENNEGLYLTRFLKQGCAMFSFYFAIT